MSAPQYTYRAHLNGDSYQYIKFFGWAMDIHRTNKRPVHCGQCAALFPIGDCVKHIEYLHNYFICIQCAKNLILQYGASGFRVNLLGNLNVVDLAPPAFTARQVVNSIEKHAFTVNQDGIVVLLDFGAG